MPFVLGAGTTAHAFGPRPVGRRVNALGGPLAELLQSRQDFLEALHAGSPPPTPTPPLGPGPRPTPPAPSQPPTSLSSEELKNMRDRLCEIVRRYGDEPDKLDEERDILAEGLETIMQGLNERERASMLEFAKKQCPDLDWIFDFIAGLTTQPPTPPPLEPPGPDVPTFDPFTTPSTPIRPGGVPVPTGGGAQQPTYYDYTPSPTPSTSYTPPQQPTGQQVWPSASQGGGFQFPGLIQGLTTAGGVGGMVTGGMPGLLAGSRLPVGGKTLHVR